MNKTKHKQAKVEWRKRTVGTKSQVGKSFVLEPHGHRSDLPRNGLIVTTPAIARHIGTAVAKIVNLPKTIYTDKKDKDRVKYFEDLIKRGIVPPPAEIHKRPDGTFEVLDGKHRIEAYRNLDYKKIPVVTNATIGEISKAITEDYAEEMLDNPYAIKRTRLNDKEKLAALAINSQTADPLLNDYTVGAFDASNPLMQSGEEQVDNVLEMRRRRMVRSGNAVTQGTWGTRNNPNDSQYGQHFFVPHGDKTALPKELTVANLPPIPASPSVAGLKNYGLNVQYIDEDIRDKNGYKYMAMNYQEAAELGIYFPYSEDTILISSKLNSEERSQALEMQTREIAKMKSGASYLEAHARVITEMPKEIPKKAGFWDAVKGLAVSAMERQKRAMEPKTEEAKLKKDAVRLDEMKKIAQEDAEASEYFPKLKREPELTDAKDYAEKAIAFGNANGIIVAKAKDTRTSQKQKKDMLVS